jgi:hypothetical protein
MWYVGFALIDPWASGTIPSRPSFQISALVENRSLGFLGFAFQGALEGLIQGGLRLQIFFPRDFPLCVLYFELEELFFQAFEEHGRRTARSRGSPAIVARVLARGRGFGGLVVLVVIGGWSCLARGTRGSIRSLLFRGDEDSTTDQRQGEASKDIPLIFL